MKKIFVFITLILVSTLLAGGNILNFRQGQDTITWSTTDSLATGVFSMPIGINTVFLEGIFTIDHVQYLDTHRVQLTPLYAFDSADYTDTIVMYNGADSSEIVWTSPLEVLTLTPAARNSFVYTYTFVFPDTSISASDTSDASATGAEICDSIVLSVAADSVLNARLTAEDSATYVKLISNFSEITYGGKWSITPGDSLTADTTVITTIAMVCDSINAAINAESEVTDSVTAEDSVTYVKTYCVEGGRPYMIWTDTLQSAVTIDTAYYSKFGEGPDSLKLALYSSDGIHTDYYDSGSVDADLDTAHLYFYEDSDSLLHWHYTLDATWRATNAETPTATDSAYLIINWTIKSLEVELK